ncbi:MAG: lytic murein transglycosylase [Deltaproteobacteria bacterium]|nr:lytic murein transglycosylase [Deltaproteobacteria bacterium]MBW2019300.1 lytic murein transglycosylase [Deltaproteobacteria bacterium]MBW2074079.1 lytic murein transglycosylase [Deltaproteobacteria bacterium]
MGTISTLLFRHNSGMRAQLVLAIVVLCSVALIPLAHAEPSNSMDPFSNLQRRLIRDDFDRALIRSLYSRPEVGFDKEAVSAYFLHREATLNYDQFLTQSSIDQAAAYLIQHQKALKRAESVYGVDGEVITAIILVESRLGTLMGKRLVLNTLSTLAALSHAGTRERLWRALLKHKANGPKNQFDAWATQKSAWAYGELKAYLKYISTQGLNPFSMYGSYAGALGIAQFMPSSVLKFARDGNRDGQINLYHHEDAIESIANYLKRHGWHPGLKHHEAFLVLLSYNHSKYYADTIIKVAERLSKLRPK